MESKETKRNLSIHQIIKEKDDEIILLYISEYLHVVNAEDKNRDRPLHIASKLGKLQIVEGLLAANADPNLTGAYGFTPLHTSAYYEQNEVTKALIKGGAEVDNVDQFGYTPLKRAVITNLNTKTISSLLEAKADINHRDPETGETILEVAFSKGNKDIARFLIEKKANVNAAGEKGRTLLQNAALFEFHEDLNILLGQEDIDIEAVGNLRFTALQIANWKAENFEQAQDISNVLIDHGAIQYPDPEEGQFPDPDSQNNKGI